MTKRTTGKKAAKKTRKIAPKVPRAATKKRVSVGKDPKPTAKRTLASSLAKRATAKPRATKAVKKATAPKPSLPRRAARKTTAVRPSKAVLVCRRAVFIDVENTSSQAALLEVLESLKIDQQKQKAELVAVGNWRAVGPQVGRDLAALGAQLVHSAPARGVRDWSDLWIAVAAGAWIARAAPGDVLEIVSNDRAFDAVGDAAAAQGVVYRRIQHRRSGSAPSAEIVAETPATPRPRGGRRGRRSRRPNPTESSAAAIARPAAVRQTHATHTPAADAAAPEPHGASRDQMVDLVQRLAQGRPSPWVNLDVLETALKREGYSRPANSPRLVTRLRRLKDFEVDSHGRVRLASATDGDLSAGS